MTIKNLLASIRFTFDKNESNRCFWDCYFVPASNGLCKKLNFFRSSHRTVFYKIGASFFKELWSFRFPTLITAAMWTILDAAGLLDPLLAFTYRKNDSYFNFNDISVYKVYIDFWIKILGRLFVNDKQILTECFKSFITL